MFGSSSYHPLRLSTVIHVHQGPILQVTSLHRLASCSQSPTPYGRKSNIALGLITVQHTRLPPPLFDTQHQSLQTLTAANGIYSNTYVRHRRKHLQLHGLRQGLTCDSAAMRSSLAFKKRRQSASSATIDSSVGYMIGTFGGVGRLITDELVVETGICGIGDADGFPHLFPP